MQLCHAQMKQPTAVDVLVGIHVMLWIVAWLFDFSAGQYTCKDGKNRSCLVYVGFNHKIYVYYKVELERMESTNLLKVLEEKSEFKGHLKELGVGECTRKFMERSFRSAWSILNHVQSDMACFCGCNWTRGQLWLFVVHPSGR